jgi:hypothetical protein
MIIIGGRSQLLVAFFLDHVPDISDVTLAPPLDLSPERFFGKAASLTGKFRKIACMRRLES